MKSFAKILIAAAAVMMLMPQNAVAQTHGPRLAATQAVMRVYNEELERNPENYSVYLKRAHLLYGQSQYARALSDVDNALRYTPKTDKDMLMQEHALRANIFVELDRPADALPDITEACRLNPSSYTLCYQKANIEYAMGDYAAAKADYQRLERMQNRSLESLIGLARVAVAENDYATANRYADDAVSLYPANPQTYMRRASVRRLLNNNTGAVADIIMALSLDPGNPKAINSLVEISNVDYAAVISALTSAASAAPSNGMYVYIRGAIEQAHYHYLQAADDYQKLIDGHFYNYAGIYASLAQCRYALCDFDAAVNEINHAIGMTVDNGPYYIVSSRIRLAQGFNEVALHAATNAVSSLPDNAEALRQLALCQIALKRYADASSSLGEAIINDADDPLNYLLRGWILAYHLGINTDANAFLTRCIELPCDDLDIRSLRGFALNLMGENEQARQWIDAIMNSNPVDVDGRVAYLAACLYAHLGDTDRAFECMTSALKKGYGNLYDWRLCDTANINVAPLRTDERFDRLINAYSFLFKK